MRALTWVLTGTLMLPGCALHVQPHANLRRDAAARYCLNLAPDVTAAARSDGGRVDTGDRSDGDAAAAARAAGFSEHAVATARIAGVLPLLARIDDGTAAQRVTTHGRITRRLLGAMLDVNAMQAVLDCENERVDQLRDRLRGLEDEWSRTMSRRSILIGALTAIGSGWAALVAPQAATSAVAGIVGGSLGAGAELISQSGTASGRLRTPSNLIGELWRAPARPALFPPSVWAYLQGPAGRQTEPDDAVPSPPPLARAADDARPTTRRELLLARWAMDAGFDRADATPKARRQAELLFGDGGQYTVADLNLRDQMNDLLRATIGTMMPHLRALLTELDAHEDAQQGGPAATPAAPPATTPATPKRRPLRAG